jgi:hypothetical protein
MKRCAGRAGGGSRRGPGMDGVEGGAGADGLDALSGFALALARRDEPAWRSQGRLAASLPGDARAAIVPTNTTRASGGILMAWGGFEITLNAGQ